MTEYIASSLEVGRRPRISLLRAYSSAFSPSSAHGCSRSGSFSARPTVSSTGKGYRPGPLRADSEAADRDSPQRKAPRIPGLMVRFVADYRDATELQACSCREPLGLV